MKITNNQTKYIGDDLVAMSKAHNYNKWITSIFEKYTGERILEVGAGSGNFSKYFLDNKKIKDILLIEPSKEMYELLKRNTQDNKIFRPYHGFLSNVYKDIQNIDTAFYINVMEHVEDDDNEVSLISKVLNKNGYICIYVPALNWLMGEFDHKVGHYRRYNKKMMRSLLESNGFEIIKMHYSDIYGIAPWFIKFKLLKHKDLSAENVGIYDKYIIPILRRQEMFLKPPIGKNLIAVARKI